uniref:SFRICE_025139 n=1 Tax=Spodoptera frugiperda TaxID=7108 RepID=A0A2H1WUU2_SPOFR
MSTSKWTPLTPEALYKYVAIVKPLQHRLSRRVARAALFTVWCASALLALPSLLYSDTYKKHFIAIPEMFDVLSTEFKLFLKYVNGDREICFIKWPDGSYPSSRTDYVGRDNIPLTVEKVPASVH